MRKYYKKINFVNIKEIEKVLSKIKEKKFILDNTTCSLKFENIISYNNSVLNQKDPIYDFKAIKTKKEIQNLKNAHIFDGVALTKYLFWLKKIF